MRMYDIIKKKRDGDALSKEEIRFFIEGYTNGDIPDYQAAALCMAIYFKGMNSEETAELTMAVRDSGDILHLDSIKGLRVDKHSTGGVGDKTSLVIAPIAAALGITVAKISGRGLGHTGGTVDKLESIEGLRTDFTLEEFEKIVEKTNLSIIGQSADFAPADKKLYALRDVTATVDSMPLIASSIMGKKLAANDDCIVLDVKSGSGSFMKTLDDSKRLARIMVDIGSRAGKKVMAIITDMDRPLGEAIGNSLEVIEAVNTLKGNGPDDFTELCTKLSAYMLELSEKGSFEECLKKVKDAIENGSALEKFCEMVEAQGGNPEWLRNTELFPKAKYSKELISQKTGWICHVNTESYGLASLLLGAGRNTKEDKIDNSAGILLKRRTGDFVNIGDTIAVLYTSEKPEKLEEACAVLLSSTEFSDEKPEERPLILDIIKSDL